MKISTKGRYALRVMIDIAIHSNGRCVSIKEIAGRQEISENIWNRFSPCSADRDCCAARAARRGAILSLAIRRTIRWA